MPDSTPAQLAAAAQDASRRDDYETVVQLVRTYLACDPEAIDRTWGLGLLGEALRKLRDGADTPEAAKRLGDEAAAVEREIMEATEVEDAPWLHRWERARQLNGQAWDVYDDADASPRALTEALAQIDEALSFWPYFWPYLDTRVRLLLRLHRAPEAFEAVRLAERLQPGWPDFEDIVARPDYRRHCDTVPAPPLPPGLATEAPVIPDGRDVPRTGPDEPLSAGEHLLLLRTRLGEHEWARARNVAVIATLLDGLATVESLPGLRPQDVDLTAGTGPDGRRLSPRTLEKLRHWMLWGHTNHAVVFDASTRHPMRDRLFYREDARPLAVRQVNQILAAHADALDLAPLSTERFGAVDP